MKNANIRSLLWSFKSTSLHLDIGSCLQEELIGKISFCKGSYRGPKSEKGTVWKTFLSQKLYTKRLKEARKSMKNAKIRGF